MLLTAHSLKELSFRKLMEVYSEACMENGADLAPEETQQRQIQLAEDAFYDYLHDCFFSVPGAAYAVWEEDGTYISALRIEPYRDGILLEALETAPDYRRRGYAAALIDAVQKQLAVSGSVRLYSHVNKKNHASMRTHVRCGFRLYQDYAAYIDGSVNRRAVTMLWET